MYSDLQVSGKKRRELVLHSTRSLLPKRRLELMVADTAIFLAVCSMVKVLLMLDISALSGNSGLTLGKALVLYVCMMAARLCSRVYTTVWRYANASAYLKLMTADAAGGFVFFLIGQVSAAVRLGAVYALAAVLLVMLGALASRSLYQYLYARAGTVSDQRAMQELLLDYPLGGKPGERNTGYDERKLREFSINDLLLRDELSIASTQAKDYYRDKTVLVTGGGGSIGSELCWQIAALAPRRLVILDIYENNAYNIQQELMHEYGEDLTLETVIASVRDEKRMEEIFAEVRPDIIFHAAAHKHVPLMEHSGCEAIKNNVFGTYNVADLAEKYGAEKFVLISTDKAINPTSIMGASKRLCEMVIQCRTDSTTAFAAVRFGNVLGSNGSVIPLFKKQIAAGGPVTITDKRVFRYFMTIPEAVGLVMEAGAMAKNGELFVLDMGKPVRILDLAENMIRLSGLRPYEDVDILEIGLRPGEKLYEEPLIQIEKLERTKNKMVFIERDEGYSRAEVDAKLEILDRAVSGLSGGEEGHYEKVIEAIRTTVPTYRDPEEVNRDTILVREKA